MLPELSRSEKFNMEAIFSGLSKVQIITPDKSIVDNCFSDRYCGSTLIAVADIAHSITSFFR